MNFNRAYRILKSYTERKATGGRTSHYDIDEAIKTVLPILAEKYDKDCEEAFQKAKIKIELENTRAVSDNLINKLKDNIK